MKFTIAAVASMATIAMAAPTDIKYDVDWTKITYPEGTGKDAVPKGGWESVKYPASAGASAGASAACTKNSAASPFHFTSTYTVQAEPGQVVNGTTPTGGLAGASGIYAFGINSVENTICYNITLYNFRGNFQSPALTATHIHEAAKGASGPPRIAFPNPVGDEKVRKSIGCVTGPFTTGVKAADGSDTGAAFHVSQIEKNPAAFFADAHSSLAVPGAVRGQLA